MKKNVTPNTQAHDGMALPRDVPQTMPFGHPSESHAITCLGERGITL